MPISTRESTKGYLILPANISSLILMIQEGVLMPPFVILNALQVLRKLDHSRRSSLRMEKLMSSKTCAFKKVLVLSRLLFVCRAN